jgi:hypothetical protein
VYKGYFDKFHISLKFSKIKLKIDYRNILIGEILNFLLQIELFSPQAKIVGYGSGLDHFKQSIYQNSK